MFMHYHPHCLKYALLAFSLLSFGTTQAQSDVTINDRYDWYVQGLYVKSIYGYNDNRVAVVPRGTYSDHGYIKIYPSYSGDVVVPAVVQDEYGNKMVVVSLDGSFSNCSNLTSVKLSEGLEEINGAFDGCTKLTTVTIPNSVTRLAGSIFYGCTSLTNVNFNKSADLNSDCFGIFEGCTSLSTIELPSHITYLPDNAFYGCTSLTSVKLSDNITKAGDDAFNGCTALTEITLPSALTNIGDRQFNGCSSLLKVVMGDNIREIGIGAFFGCSSLKSITLPEGITSLPLAAFRECSNLESISLPSTLTQIKAYVFYLSDNLKDVYCWATTPPAIDEVSFSTFGTLHVPAGCKAAYQSASYWNNFTIVEDVATQLQQVSTQDSGTSHKVWLNGSLSVDHDGQQYDLSGRKFSR